LEAKLETLIFTILGCSTAVFCITLLVLPKLLDNHILSHAPKRDVFTDSNMWSLTLRPEFFNSEGIKIRNTGFKILWGSAIVCASVILLIIVFLVVVAYN